MRGAQQMACFGEGGHPTLSLLLEQVVRQQDLSLSQVEVAPPTLHNVPPAWTPKPEGKDVEKVQHPKGVPLFQPVTGGCHQHGSNHPAIPCAWHQSSVPTDWNPCSVWL